MSRITTAAISAMFALGAATLALPAAAEIELSFYTGIQDSPHSRVEGNDGTADFNFMADWEGRSGEMPPYYGFRATWWRSENIGFGVEFNHTKAYLSDDDLKAEGFDTLEFSDGLNSLTANVFYRWPGQWGDGKLTPYVGGGLGLSIPHVEVTRNGAETFEYQITGPSVMLAAGVSYAFNETWSAFAEYKGTYSSNTAELDNGGELETDIITNAFNIGVSYSF